ncbi:carbohydrate ABC transporter permease [Dictyobacter formicarum]|uniref:ABC transporter permease protein YtcP n=1 Tax=Dictyobacter formicarum TaxID=2778368 RepID=A0ABQ3VG03_9CHLR|nr:carbohydrate ABC transporter permease [Dictyobacter formicarum]GHO84046.1 putative ABC transporter permease protein YtcP [Dictyobacter formicarum]
MPTWERSSFLSRWALYISMLLLAVIMLFPFVYILAVSLSSYADVAGGRLIIFPLHPTLEAYQWILKGGTVVQGLLVSITVTLLGTAISMLLTTTMAYGLSRKNVIGSKVLLWMVLLAMLLAPTMITRYLVVRELHLIDTIWALVIPSAVAPFNLIVMRQFFMALPQELMESAKMDGANDLRTFWSIVLPLSKAPLAAISLFYAVGQWNSFFDAVLFINNAQLYPITIVMRQIILQGTIPADTGVVTDVAPPDITIQMAVVVITIIPILIVYPFLQKHFAKGVLTGAIKG